MNTMPLEADTRILIDKSLENLGWKFTGKEKNVFCEQPKTEEERRKLQGKRPDYVLYSKENDRQPLIIIEAKKKGERIDTALKQGIHYAKQLGAPIVFATDGLFCKSFHTFFEKTPILNGEEVDEFVREVLALKFLNTWEVNTISPKVQYDRKELIKIFDEANNMLRGDGLRAGIERFGEFANILFLKLISESEDLKRLDGIQSDFDDMCHWNYIKNLKASSRIEHINKIVYEKLNSLYKTDIFTPLTIRDASILKEIMDKLDPLTLTDVDSDVKGDAFEYFLKESTATKNDLGEYFTPRHIVKTMVKLVNPQIGEKVYDPFCGTGGFLIESFRHIYNTMPRTAVTEKMIREQTIYGNEITNTARITKMNMILAGDGHSNIHMKDSLANPVHGEYDIILANMPYSQKTKHGNLYELASNNGDSICVQHCMKAISATSENGRMALVVPEGFLFRKDLAKAREYMLENCQLQSIISLPQGVFLPYTGVKTNIIYATKINQKIRSTEKRKDFWYFDVKSDGYTLDNHRRKLDTTSDLTKYEEYRKLDNDQADEMMQIGFGTVSLDKVRESSFILVGSRYKEHKSIFSKYDNVTLGEVATIIRGVSFPKSAQKTSQGDYLGIVTTKAAQIDGIHKEHIVYVDKEYLRAEKLLKCGDTLISLANSINLVGRVTYVDADYTDLSFGAFMGIIRADKVRIIPKLLFYILQSDSAKDYFITNAKTTTNISNLTFEDLNDYSFPLPLLDVQQQIVDEVERYQRIIDGARTVVESYKPTINFESSWIKVKLKEVCQFSGGTQPPKSAFKFRYEEGYIRLLQIRDYKNDDYATYIPITSRHKTCSEEDIMIGRYGPPVFQILRGKRGAYNVALIKCIIDKDRIINDWLYYFLRSNPVQNYIIGISTRARQAGVSPEDLGNLDIPLPPLETQKQIVDQINTEQQLIEPSKQIIEIFTKKIKDRINEIFM